MAKKNQNACERLKNAVSFSSFRRFHRVSNHQQNHSAPTPTITPTPTPQPFKKPIKAYVSQPSSGQLIPIDTAAQCIGQPINAKVERAQAMFLAKQKRTHERNNGGVQGNNHRISEYITRVRDDMRTTSDLGIERNPTKKISRRDSLNDRVANFLTRTKIKFITTSSIGHGVHGNGHDY